VTSMSLRFCRISGDLEIVIEQLVQLMVSMPPRAAKRDGEPTQHKAINYNCHKTHDASTLLDSIRSLCLLQWHIFWIGMQQSFFTTASRAHDNVASARSVAQQTRHTVNFCTFLSMFRDEFCCFVRALQ
jgi:hypothetical protein